MNKKPNFMVKRGKQLMHSKWNVKEVYPEFDIFEKTLFSYLLVFGKVRFFIFITQNRI